MLGPALNVARVPWGGRNFECVRPQQHRRARAAQRAAARVSANRSRTCSAVPYSASCTHARSLHARCMSLCFGSLLQIFVWRRPVPRVAAGRAGRRGDTGNLPNRSACTVSTCSSSSLRAFAAAFALAGPLWATVSTAVLPIRLFLSMPHARTQSSLGTAEYTQYTESLFGALLRTYR